MVKSAYAEDMGQFLYHLDHDTTKITRRLEKLQLKIINSVISSLIKLAWITCCLNIHPLISFIPMILTVWKKKNRWYNS